MTRHVVAEVASFPDKGIRRVEVGGREICLVRVGDEFFALLDRCPHGGARLSGRRSEMLKCPWHGWEYDVRTGQSWSDPKSTRTRAYSVEAVAGEDLVRGPYVADTVAVEVEGRYVVVDLPDPVKGRVSDRQAEA
jgi:nitrite reductase/ring-hydroxylating ferredoxin subunit